MNSSPAGIGHMLLNDNNGMFDSQMRNQMKMCCELSLLCNVVSLLLGFTESYQ